MRKTVLITGSTDGIGVETARLLASQGHHVLIHGRNPAKLKEVEKMLSGLAGAGHVESYLADLSNLSEVEELAAAVAERHGQLYALINNAGVFRTSKTTARNGLDVRFVVNTLAPYLLTQQVLPLLPKPGRVINLSSAAQSPVDLEALAGRVKLTDDFTAYAQSKLALTMWSRHLGLALREKSPSIIAVNPGSMLGSKMLKEGFGVDGKDIGIGAEILTRLVLENDLKSASGQYFDNDVGRYALPHVDALNPKKSEKIVCVMESLFSIGLALKHEQDISEYLLSYDNHQRSHQYNDGLAP